MSVLETPRLIFRGKATFDPIVTNNRRAQYDEADAQTVFAPGADVAAFRQAAIAAVIGRNPDGQEIISNWNPHGTHRTTFYQTTVVGVDLGNGPSAGDPIVNSPVSFQGMLVDLEPYGSRTSQIFFDAMTFGTQGGSRIRAPRATRMTARYINFARNPVGFVAGVASVVWQTSFPKANGLRVEANDSPALQQLAQALEADDVLGLTVRWNSYRTIYFGTLDPNQNNLQVARQLQSKLAAGGFHPNPVQSEVVGVLGLWRKGEPACEPGDRALLTQTGQIASAHARLSADQLALDLANSIPETGLDLTKANLGDLTAVAVAADGKTVVAELGTFGYEAYRREAYEASAGIVTIKVDPGDAAKAQTADIQLRQQDGTILLAESALRAIPATPNTYLDEGEPATLDVLVLDRGKPVCAGTQVALIGPASVVAAAATSVTNAQGIATFPLVGRTGQVEWFVLGFDKDAPAPAAVDTQTMTYAYVRTLPADEDIAALAPTWDNVHARVLRNWHAMAPCMDNWLDLGDPDQVKSFAEVLHQLTAKTSFESFRFMPVTRDMTAGQRTLLYKFLDAAQPAAAVTATAAPRSLEQLSRAMRGN